MQVCFEKIDACIGKKSEGKEAQGEGISGKLLAAEGAIEERNGRVRNDAVGEEDRPTASTIEEATSYLLSCRFPFTISCSFQVYSRNQEGNDAVITEGGGRAGWQNQTGYFEGDTERYAVRHPQREGRVADRPD
jgi:hypothetical protein